MDQTESRRTTLLVIMVVITIVLVLSGVALIVYQQMDRHRRQNLCGKNQSQILGAMVAYNVMEETETWVPPTVLVDPAVVGARRGRLITTKVWESMASSLTLPNLLFKCSDSRSWAPNTKPNPSDPASTWGLESGRVIGYALDWTASVDPSSARVMIADRDPDAHKGSVMMTFGDAHVRKMKWTPNSMIVAGALVTEGIDGKQVSASTGHPPNDDIYSSTGDAGEPLTPGKGDPLRAWVK